MTINEILEKGIDFAHSFTDEEIEEMAYGIKYFDFGVAGITPTMAHLEIMDYLRKRLDAIPKEKPKPPTNIEMVKCRCGHTVPKNLVMSTSSGSSCPDCYDRMSC